MENRAVRQETEAIRAKRGGWVGREGKGKGGQKCLGKSSPRKGERRGRGYSITRCAVWGGTAGV